MRLILRLIIHLHDHVIHQKGLFAVRPGSVHLRHRTINVGRHQHLVTVDNLILVHDANDIAARHRLPLAHVGGMKGPPHIAGEARNVHSLGHVDVAAVLKNVLQRPLDPVENGAHDAGAKLHRKRLLLTQHGIAHGEARRVLVDLNGGRVALQLDDFAHELGVAHADEFVHGRAGHAVGYH